MLQHTSSEVTVGGKNANKYKRNVKDWYLIRKMKYKQTDFSMKSAKQTKPSKKRKSFSLPTFSFKAGCNSRINKVSFILQCKSERPVANISK